MTKETKLLSLELLKGNTYLAPRPTAKGTTRLMLYRDKQVPVRYFSRTSVTKLMHLFKKDSRSGRITLNLSLVRRLHGKSYVKKLYKNLKTQI